MAVLARPLFALTASGFSAGKLNEAIRLFYAMLPLVLLTGIASNCTAVLNTLERFSLPALAQLTMPAAVVGAALLLHARFGVWALVYGTLAGALVHLLLVAGMMQSNGFRFRLSWYGNDEATREVARQYGAVLLSSLVASGGLLVDQGMAATLPPGSVSALVFANRFVSVVVMLLAGAVSSAVVPYFSSMVAIEDWRGCRRSLHTWSGIMAAVSVPITALLIIGAQPLIRLTLQHGAFGKEDTAVVTTVLVMYAVQIPFFVVSRVFYRFIVAMRRTDLVLYCGLLNLGLDIIFNLVLMRRMGIAGIALSTSLWTISTCGFLAFWAYRLLRSAEDAPLALRTSREAR
jgi:putative peptidoglycan lipid II flippase